jgi:hypothetical protein
MKTICPTEPNVRIAVTGHGVGIPSENFARVGARKGGRDLASRGAGAAHAATVILEQREQSKAQAA